jgi:hypothetical protein
MTTAARSKQHQRDADLGAQPDHEAGRSRRRRVRADRGQEHREGRDSPGGLLAVMDVFAEPSRAAARRHSRTSSDCSSSASGRK